MLIFKKGFIMQKKYFFLCLIMLVSQHIGAMTHARDEENAYQRMGHALQKVAPKVFVINLKERPDRLQKFDELMSKMNLAYDRIEAKNCNDAIHEHPEWVILMDSYKNRLVSKMRRVGCSMSHLESIKQGIASGAPAVIIFEDDVAVPENLNECCAAFEQAIQDLQERDPAWDMLYLGGSFYRQQVGHVIEHKLTQHLSKITGAYGCYATIYSRAGLIKLKRIFEEYMQQAVDAAGDLGEQHALLTQEIGHLNSLSDSEVKEAYNSEKQKEYVSHIGLNTATGKVDEEWKKKELQPQDVIWADAQEAGTIRAYAVNPFFMGQLNDYSSVCGQTMIYAAITDSLGKLR